MKRVKITSSGYNYYAIGLARTIRSPREFAEGRLVNDYHVKPGDEVSFYSGAGDWNGDIKPREYAEALVPLIVAIKIADAIPVLVGCSCYKEKKEELAALLGISFDTHYYGK